ncbi:MAG TPA: hypothetical protein VFI17_07040 [Solirubrobacterales bacterium]|nr:hypothetical protein [Solirubrobacterales bacterium]
MPSVLLTLALAVGLAACGGGGESDEDKIVSAVETAATSTDPAVCKETETLNFMEQTTGSSGKEAEEECEAEAKAGENNPDSVAVSKVEVDGGKATANAAFKGGSFNGQTLEIALVEEDGDWKLDEVAGFAKFDRGELTSVLSEKLEEEDAIEPRIASCIVEGLDEIPDEALESLVLTNDSQPIVELAESCE